MLNVDHVVLNDEYNNVKNTAVIQSDTEIMSVIISFKNIFRQLQ